MGVGGFFKKLGKGALKVGKYAAPIALGMTGVGLPAAMALSGGLNALDTKVSGGSWKDALLSGGIGAGAAAIPIPGLGPSANVAQQGVNQVAGQVARRGTGAFLGSLAKETGKSLLRNPLSALELGTSVAGAIKRGPSNEPDRTPSGTKYGGGQQAERRDYMKGIGPTLGNLDQSNPNLAEFIGAGRRDAIRNQPFRKGYDVISYGPEPENDEEGNIGPEIRTPMPPIYGPGGRRGMGARL